MGSLLTADVIASDDGNHRLWLARETRYPVERIKHEMVIFGMLNPSLARGVGVEDPTSRKCDGFAGRLGAPRWGIFNLFSASTPYPKELFFWDEDYAIGPDNDDMTRRVLTAAEKNHWPVICAWGKPSLPKEELGLVVLRSMWFFDLATEFPELRLYALGTTDCGLWPRHPLMLGYEHATLKTWRPL